MAKQVDQKSLSQFSKKPPNLSHLKKLTTPLGVVQHAQGESPDLRHGYSIDDTARALVACIWYAELFEHKDIQELIPIYVKHLVDAQLPNGRFHNFKDKDGKFLDEVGSDDSFGRTVWALGVAAQSRLVDQKIVQQTLKKALPHVENLPHLRSIGFALLGLIAEKHPISNSLGQKLVNSFNQNAQENWQWFEQCLYYSNAILPYALLKVDNSDFKKVSLKSLEFLNRESRVGGTPAPIGFEGWYCRGGERAMWGQQPIDAADMVLVNAEAYSSTSDKKYLEEAVDWINWFHGFNVRRADMITDTGGSYDGIWENKINTNMGAESVIVYILAYLSLSKIARRLPEIA